MPCHSFCFFNLDPLRTIGQKPLMVEQLQPPLEVECGTSGIPPPPRKLMVVVDSTKESIGALHYTLFHEVVPQDELILIHVESPTSWKNPLAGFLRRPILSNLSSNIPSSNYERELPGGADFLEEMKHACEVVQPKVGVRTVKIQTDTNNKADAILWQTERLEIDLLVVGQRSRSSLSNSILG